MNKYNGIVDRISAFCNTAIPVMIFIVIHLIIILIVISVMGELEKSDCLDRDQARRFSTDTNTCQVYIDGQWINDPSYEYNKSGREIEIRK